MKGQRRYFSYLLRLWETSNGEKQIWRASLESPGSGQRHGFASLQSLVDFLQAEIGSQETQRREPDTEEEAEG